MTKSIGVFLISTLICRQVLAQTTCSGDVCAAQAAIGLAGKALDSIHPIQREVTPYRLTLNCRLVDAAQSGDRPCDLVRVEVVGDKGFRRTQILSGPSLVLDVPSTAETYGLILRRQKCPANEKHIELKANTGGTIEFLTSECKQHIPEL